MSTIAEKTLDDGIMDTVGNSCKFIEFLNTEEETELERSLLDACRHAENVDRESEKKQSSTSIVNEEKDQTTSNDKLNNKNSTDNERQDNISIEKDNSAEKKASEDAPEHLTEPNMDYTLDDVIEIYDISDEEDDPVEHVVSTIIKEQEKGSRIKVEKMLNANEVNIINDDDDDDNEELLSVFNDHNYISQETLTPSASDIQSNNDLRQNIIDHIVKKRSMEMSNGNGNASTFNDEESCNSSTDSAIEDNAKKEIEDFVDQILEGKIENFVKKEIKTEACIITEDFIQNVFNAVADEDAAEYAAEASLSEQQQSEQQNLNKKFNNETTTDGGQRLAEVITYNINSKTDNRSDRNLNQLVNELSLNPSSCTENHCDKVAIEKDMQIDQNDGDGMEFLDNENGNPMTNSTASTTESRFESNGTLPDYCSEPLEAIPLEERFQMDIDEEIDFLEQFNNDLPPSETTNFAEDALQLKNISESENCVEENGNGVAKPPAVTPEQKEAQNEEETTKQNEEVVVSVTKTVEEEEKENADSSSRSEFNRPLMETAATAATAEESNKITNDADNPNLYTDFQSSLEEKLESMDRAMDEAEAVCPKSLVLEEFCALIKEMHDDCEKFSAATTSIDLRLGSYINDKLEIMRQLARNCDMSFAITERSTQTGPELSRKLLKKLNKEDKKELLNSSDDSSSHSGASGASSDDEHSNLLSSDRRAKRKHKHHNRSSPLSSRGSRSEERPTAEDTQEQVQTEKPSDELQETIINIESVYDDGIVLSKYLRSNVFSSPRLKSEDDKISNGSVTRSRLPSRSSELDENDEGAAKSKQESAGGDKEKTKIKENKTDTRDEKDKEIERLINLDGLMRRPIKAGNSKQSDVEKLKTKPPNLKKTNGIEEFLENDLDKESLASEESANEDEEEVITEKQYLKRFNEDLKKQLLNDSSNDSTADEKSDEELGTVLSDESESGNRSPLVDKFLKTYNVDESDTDADAEMPLDDAPSKVLLETTPKCEEPNKPDDDDQDQLQKEPKEKSAGNSPDSDNSDCELLNDNFVYRKRSQPKSLEKILIEAEKRKKIQKLDEDLISLSSESYSSDVEAVEIEPADAGKKRAIKAMLRPDQLQRETVKAQKSESDRIRRLEKKQTLLTKALAENKNLNVNEELVLDYSEETKTFIKVHSELVKHLKPHQRDGVKFMYDSCYGGVDSVKKNHGSGCILAHCMGLGKTLQLIALMHTVISHKELKTHKILVLCPKSTVMNWADEIERWLLPLRTKNIKLFTFNDTSDINDKLGILRDWSLSKYQKAGCLLIGYEAFRTLVFYHKYKNRNNLDPTRLEKIRDLVNEYLLQPGADLVVCDEGHIIKNSKSAISLAVAEIKTQKRIVLTGTPIQNNLKEYYSMVNFIKPLFLGTEKEFANLYANPIKNGQHKDSSKKDIKVMKQRSFVLHKKLSKFVQRKEAELLKTFLPKKFEYVLFIPMTNVQNKLYERILETINSRQDNRGRGLITDYTCLRKIWTHPKVLEDAWKNAINQKFKRDARKQANSDDDQPDDIYDSQTGIMSVKNDWWRHLIDAKDLESILPSNKLRTMFEILRMCEENGDKCLIFSAFVAVLNVVEYFFKKLAEGHKETLSELNLSQGLRSTWEPHKDYFRLDGKTPKTTRHEMIKRFNHPNNTRARVFLISAKAGGQGINLTGANRVIILDTSWNPSNDQQNIFRIFRLGQKKNCYIYRLLALGTMEEKVYSRSVTKQAMSFRVMDVQQIDRHYSMAELAELYTLTIPNYAERPTPILPQDTILANLLRSYPDLVYKYHEHDSLLENKVEQELSEQEKIDAWQAYESDLHMNSQAAHMDEMQNKMAQGHMQNYMGAGLGSPMQQGLNLQALLNFRNVNAAAAQSNAASSYINSPILQQYSKYSMANQQYLDLVNSYRQYSTPEGSAAFNASVAAAYSGMYPGVAAASLPPHLANSANASLNALNDLSMYGLGLNSSTSSAAAAAVAAAAAATSLASTPTNSSSMYATPTGMPGTQPVAGAGALYSNQAASYYQTLQQMAYAGSAASSSSNLMNNSYVHSPASFQAPKQTQPPQQSNARKSTTPEMPPYRTSGGSMSLSPRPTASAMPPSVEISKSNTVHNPISNTKSTSSTSGNINYNNKNNNELINSGSGRRQTDSLNRTNAKATSASSNTAISASAAAKTTTARMETTNSVSQNSQTTSAASTSTTFATTSSSISTSKPFTNTTKHTAQAPSTKSSDPQIRVKDMGQLCANTNRSSTLPAAAAAVVREIKGNSYSNNSNQKNTMDVRSSSKQHQVMDNRLINTTTATSATDLLKARSEMQIIPTTSPPGTASISKQLSEISPSISLTAVRNNNKSSGSGSTSNSFPKTSTVVTSGAMNNNNNNTTTARDSTTTSSTKVSSMLSNRKQTSGINALPPPTKSNIPSSAMNVIGQNNSNLTISTKKPSSTNLVQSKKNATPTKQSFVTMTPTSGTSGSGGVKTTKTQNAVNVVNNNKNINDNNQYTSESVVRAKLASVPSSTLSRITTPTPTTTTTPSAAALRNAPNILRSNIKKKAPSPILKPLSVQRNTVSNINTSTNAIQSSSSSSNQSSIHVNSKPTTTPVMYNTTKNVVPSNLPQIFNNNNKTNTSAARNSYSPTTTLVAQQQRTSRTASPAANASTIAIEKVISNNKIRVNKHTITPLETTTTTTTTTKQTESTAFPVQLQRSNSALGASRAVTPISITKITSDGPSSGGNRSKSSNTIITPQISSVTSLNTSKPSTSGAASSAASNISHAAATAMRVAALKKLTTSNSGKMNTHPTKPLQSSSLSTKHSRQNEIVTSKASIQQSQQSAQSNGGQSVNVNTAPSRSLTGDSRITGLNIRPIIKTASPTASAGMGSAKRSSVAGVPMPSAGGWMGKQFVDRKRKAPETLNKESGNLSKRPKDS